MRWLYLQLGLGESELEALLALCPGPAGALPFSRAAAELGHRELAGLTRGCLSTHAAPEFSLSQIRALGGSQGLALAGWWLVRVPHESPLSRGARCPGLAQIAGTGAPAPSAALSTPVGAWPPRQQEWRGPAPLGVGAAWAHEHGQRGQGTRLGNIELGWGPHRDLPEPSEVFGLPSQRLRHRIHGTASLGCALGRSTHGILGVASDAELDSLSSPRRALQGDCVHLILQSILELLQRGVDVLLIELDLLTESGARVPVDALAPAHAAIAAAVERGVTVVLPAGNSRLPLEHQVDTSGRAIWGVPGADSGAVIVGGVRPGSGTGPGVGMSQCNHGARVDCHAWAERVTSCGGFELRGPDQGLQEQPSYLGSFCGSSAAAAIVAGICLVLIGAARERGQQLSPARLRALLRDPALGTAPHPQSPRIGVMPDLRALLGALEP